MPTDPKKKRATRKAVAKKAAKPRAQGAHSAKKRAAAPETTTTEPKAQRATRKDAVLALVSRPKGATLTELMESTGWRAHSVRGMISTLTKAGNAITSSKNDAGARVYKA